jgi:hypothetical protein
MPLCVVVPDVKKTLRHSLTEYLLLFGDVCLHQLHNARQRDAVRNCRDV